MDNQKKVEKEIAGVIGKVLRDNFGKGPGNVTCSLSDSVLVAYITNFASQIELSLMNLQQTLYVEKTRDILMTTLRNEIQTFIEHKIRSQVKEFYFDWNLDSRTGMLIFIFDKQEIHYGTYSNQEKLHDVVSKISYEAEKTPDTIQSKKLNAKHLLVIREGILVNIEKELLSLGFEENLILAKRRLEKRLTEKYKPTIEKYFESQVVDFFIVWNFSEDKSFMLFVLKPDNRSRRAS